MSTHVERPAHARGRSCGCGSGSGFGEGCGCGGQDSLCRLESPVRPRFFCGQLLTDEDLDTMVGWAAGKFRLQRFRDGWGVACGLEVRRDPQNPLSVIVGAGYAVSCCGDDIVLCGDAALDLAGALPAADPCADPQSLTVSTGKAAASPGPTPAAVVADMKEQLAAGAGEQTPSEAAAPRWVDVVVHYEEQDADPRASLRHSACIQPPDCEPAKTREAYRLAWATGEEQPGTAAAEEWCRGYASCLDVVRRWVAEVGQSADAEARRAWLVDVLDRTPPRLFGDLRDRVCSWTAKEPTGSSVEVLAKLVLECRWAHTRLPCHVCDSATGVRLARVQLGQVGPGYPVRVLAVDNHPPFRRALGPSTAPAPFDGVNVGFLIGERWVEARHRLAALGLAAELVTVTVPATASELLALLDIDCPVVARGTTVRVQVVRFDGDAEGTGRVIGIDDGVDNATPHDLSDDEWHRVQVDRLRSIDGVTAALAQHLCDAGLTLERLATVAEDRRAETEQTVAQALPEKTRLTAAAIVDGARRAWSGRS